VVPVEFVINVFNELCDRDRPCNSKFEAEKEEIIKTKLLFNFISGQIFRTNRKINPNWYPMILILRELRLCIIHI
jgi:hypothetical protein